MIPRFAFAAAALCLFSGGGFAELSLDQKRVNLEAFDRVWTTVKEKHWDPAMGGVNWEAVRAELRPKVEKAASDAEVRGVMSDMLSRLHQSHFLVIPGSVYHDVQHRDDAIPNPGPEAAEGEAGFDVRVVEGTAFVVSVASGSSAFRQGVRPGWILFGIEGDELRPMLRRIAATYRDSTQLDLMLARSVQSRLNGPLVNALDVEFLDGRDKKVTLTLDRMAPRGEPAKFGYLPESTLWIETRRLSSGIGYIAFNLFLNPGRLIPAVQNAVRECANCSGIVIDLRGNPGGLGLLASGLAGFFIGQPDQKLGTMYMRDLPLKFVVNPRPPVYAGPLAILVDGLSASTSEIFAGGLQDLKRARIFGSRSAGATLASMIERLPNGDGFQYASAFYKSESGKALEGAGVSPDELVPITRAALLAGHDAALDAAVRWIHEQSSKGLATR